jgi:hypothetical protein
MTYGGFATPRPAHLQSPLQVRVRFRSISGRSPKALDPGLFPAQGRRRLARGVRTLRATGHGHAEDAEAVRLVRGFVAANGGDGWTCIGAEPDASAPGGKKRGNIVKWSVACDRSTDGAVVDGPALVNVDVETEAADIFRTRQDSDAVDWGPAMLGRPRSQDDLTV